MTKLKLTLLGLLAASASAACASKPEPIPAPAQATTRAPIQPPAVFQPAPDPVPAPTIVGDPNAPIPGSVADLAYQAGEDRVYFGYDQTSLSQQARETLQRQAQWLNQYGAVQMVIEGHADERGTREYNLALGARRADAVKSFLVSQGVDPSRMTTVSYGKERPIDGRSSEDGWSRNRNGYTNIVSGAVS